MKTNLFTLLLALVASAGTLFASNTQVGGIWYYFDETTHTASVTYRGNYFDSYDDEYTGSVVISSSVTYNDVVYSVTSIGEYAFVRCSGLTSIEIPNSVTSIGTGAFAACSSLTSVTIPNSVTSIGEEAFYNCSGLPVIDNIRYADTYLVEAVDETLTSYTIKDGTKWIGTGAFAGCSDLTSMTIPNSVTSIGYGAFDGCSSLTSVTIPNSVTSIGYSAFNGCGSLTSVTIPNSVTSIGDRTFDGCRSLKSVEIPNGVTSIGEEAFYNCTKLASVTIGNGVTSIGSEAFARSGLKSITIPTQIDSIFTCAFCECDSLSSVIWNAKKADIWRIEIGSYSIRVLSDDKLFDECPMLSSLTVGEEVDSLPYFWGGYYFKSDSLKSVNWNAKHCEIRYALPQNINEITFGGQVEYIPTELCHRNHGIKKVIIPNSVKTIGRMAFGCDSITTVIIGEGLTDVGDDAFVKYNGRISSITCYAKNPPIIGKEYLSDDEGLAFNTDTMFVPAESVNAYKNAYKWSQWNKLLPIGATPVETDDIHITPSENYADIIWKAIANAASYELYIEFMGNTWRFVFDAGGILTSMANHAPARYDAPQGTQSAGFSYTVMGLASGTTYNVTITAKSANGSTLNTETASFTTTGEPQGIEDVNINDLQSKKIIRDGNVYVLRGDRVFTLQGQEVK